MSIDHRTWIAIGIISGTSADAADAAMVRLTLDPTPTVELLGFESQPHPPDLRELILAACRPDGGTSRDVSELNVRLGEVFAEAAITVSRTTNIPLELVDIIGCHGQTIYHDGSAARGAVRSTLQVGEPAVIAERTGCTVASGFRGRDLAAGGEGAPLVPYVDWLLFQHSTNGRVLLNLGGIGNFTVLRAGAPLELVTGFDTGPANMILDALMKLATQGRDQYDVDGIRTARGHVHDGLLAELLSHPYYSRTPPKSAGREEFGEQLALNIWERRQALSIGLDDAMATAAALTVETVADALERWVLPSAPIQELYVSGGGARNPALMTLLKKRLPSINVQQLAVLGIDGKAKEAVAFAIFAVEAVRGHPANVPSVTGARHPVVLGSITPGRRLQLEIAPVVSQ